MSYTLKSLSINVIVNQSKLEFRPKQYLQLIPAYVLWCYLQKATYCAPLFRALQFPLLFASKIIACWSLDMYSYNFTSLAGNALFLMFALEDAARACRCFCALGNIISVCFKETKTSENFPLIRCEPSPCEQDFNSTKLFQTWDTAKPSGWFAVPVDRGPPVDVLADELHRSAKFLPVPLDFKWPQREKASRNQTLLWTRDVDSRGWCAGHVLTYTDLHFPG